MQESPLQMNFPGAAQDDVEFETLLDIIEDLQVESILEIGVWRGGTLAQFGARFPYATIVGIDPAPQIERWSPEWGELHLVTGKSQDEETRGKAITENNHRKFDIVWIDGDHEFEAVTADWVWGNKIAKKAVAFHDIVDSNNPMIEVWRVWDRLRAAFPSSTREIKNAGGNYGIGIIYL